MRVLFCLAVLAPSISLAEDFTLSSAVTTAVLYPEGATITREVAFDIPAGRHRLLLPDLPKRTDLAQVRVALEGATLGAVSGRQDYVPPRGDEDSAEVVAARAEVERLEAALRAGEAEVRRIAVGQEAAEARVAFLQKLGQGDGVAQMPVADLQALVGMIGDEVQQALLAAHEAGLQAEEAARGLQDTREALADAQQALQALLTAESERALLTVEAIAEAATSGTLTVTYTTWEAGWMPVYDLRLDRGAKELVIDRGAFVRQATGEDWQGVAVTLSTVRPSEQTEPNEVYALRRRIEDPNQPVPMPKLSSRAAMGDSMEMMAEPVMEEAVQAGASFDGLSVTYSYPDAVDIANAADALRLSLGSLETDVDLRAQAVPLYDETAFLMASFTNETGELILPTFEASFYLDGRYVGQRQIELIAAGAEADLSFGPIEGLRLTRRVLDRNEGDRGVLTRSNEQTEAVRIEVENLTSEAWPVRVIDRVPYSEQEDLAITWDATPEPSETDIDGKRGVMAWEMDVAPGGTQVITLDHSLRWPDGKVLR